MSHLWHYTCAHGRAAIGTEGALLPIAAQGARFARGGRYPLAYAPLLAIVWATDLEDPDPWALGLTRQLVTCDRTAYRYAVPGEEFTRWGRIRSALPAQLVDGLELAPGAQPARWWVAWGPVAHATYTPRQESP